MNKFSLAIVFSILFGMLMAQNPPTPVILVSSTGKVCYKGDKKINIIPGSIVKNAGQLEMSSDVTAMLYHDYMFTEVSGGASTIEVEPLFNSKELVSKIETEFGDKISEAAYSAFISGVKMKNAKSLTSGWGSKSGAGKDSWGSKSGAGKDSWGSKSGAGKDGWGSKSEALKDGWGSKSGAGKDSWGSKSGAGKDGWGSKSGAGKDSWGSKSGAGKDSWGSKSGAGKDSWGSKSGAGKDGWGESDIATTSMCPGGKYVEGQNSVYWKEIKGTKKYTFVIEDMQHNVVYSSEVSGTSLSFSTNAANLVVGVEYAWYVQHPTERKVSNPVFFRIVSTNERDKVIGEIAKLKSYQNADNSLKLLMEAHQMEENGLYLGAYETYNSAIKSNKKNSLVKMMYAYFCNRMGEVESAANALK